jgi:hypothetical protein
LHGELTRRRRLASADSDSRIGEKFLQWSDKSPPDDEILDSVTLWWLTQSFPRAIYPYRQFFGAKPTFFHNDPEFYIKKPLGYSWHPQELAPVPVALVKKVSTIAITSTAAVPCQTHMADSA